MIYTAAYSGRKYLSRGGADVITKKAAIDEALRAIYPRVRLQDIKDWLRLRPGQKLKVGKHEYRITGLYSFHITARYLKHGWTESFTYGQLWAMSAGRIRSDAHGGSD